MRRASKPKSLYSVGNQVFNKVVVIWNEETCLSLALSICNIEKRFLPSAYRRLVEKVINGHDPSFFRLDNGQSEHMELI